MRKTFNVKMEEELREVFNKWCKENGYVVPTQAGKILEDWIYKNIFDNEHIKEEINNQNRVKIPKVLDKEKVLKLSRDLSTFEYTDQKIKEKFENLYRDCNCEVNESTILFIKSVLKSNYYLDKSKSYKERINHVLDKFFLDKTSKSFGNMFEDVDPRF